MEPNLQTELPEVELTELVLSLKKEKKFAEALRLFLDLIRIRIATFLKSINHTVPGDMTTSDLVSIFSSVLKQEVGIAVLDTKIDQIIAIEEFLLETKKPTQKQLKIYICYVMDLYYQLQNFDPRYLNKEYRQRIAKMMKKQSKLSPLAKNLQYMSPLIQYVTEFKKSNSLLRKLNPFRSSTVSIPKSVSPILKEYVETKFNEQVETVQHEDQNIREMIEKTLELEEMKQSLTSAFDVVSPNLPESELLRRKGLKRYLLVSGGFMFVIGGIFLSQIAFLPKAWSLFLMFGIIPLAIFGFCIYLLSKL